MPSERSTASPAGGRPAPDLAIRSTFIVGFPGETEEHFDELLHWLREAKLDRVGCFKYEPVRGALANDCGPHVPAEVAQSRWHRFMAVQQEISRKRLSARVGRRLPVLIDEAGGPGRQGPLPLRGARDRRHGPRLLAAAAPAGRHRHLPDRAHGRLRPLRRGGVAPRAPKEIKASGWSRQSSPGLPAPCGHRRPPRALPAC